MKPGLELRGQYTAGRDPRRMTPEELSVMGHEPMSPLQAIRARCLDCCAGQANEVAVCPVVECPAWPFRMGTNPWRKPPSEARREAARRTMTHLNTRRQKRRCAELPTSPPDHGISPLLAERTEAAAIWTTARVNPASETEQYRVDEDGSGQSAEQFREEQTDPSPEPDPPIGLAQQRL
jgi:hypothetical protein